MVVSAAIHLHLWSAGTVTSPPSVRSFSCRGWQASSWPLPWQSPGAPWPRLAGAAFAASTIGGLVLSVEIGLFGFKDSLGAPWAATSLAVEAAAFLILGGSSAGRHPSAGRGDRAARGQMGEPGST